jgi:hypothetical protein
MQKTTQTNDFDHDFEPTGDPLAGSSFEQEQTDPEFSSGLDEEEAIEE